MPEAETGRARDKAAALVGANPHCISDMKKPAAEEPDLAARVRSGELKLAE